jgi:hypothetical protein
LAKPTSTSCSSSRWIAACRQRHSVPPAAGLCQQADGALFNAYVWLASRENSIARRYAKIHRFFVRAIKKSKGVTHAILIADAALLFAILGYLVFAPSPSGPL